MTKSKCKVCAQPLKYGGRGRPLELCVIHKRSKVAEDSRARKVAWRARRKAAA